MDYGTVYVLRLKENKYYVGHTINYAKLTDTLKQKEIRSPWLNRYNIIEIVFTISGHRDLKDKITLQVMDIFGWENVRGGKWRNMELSGPPPELHDPERMKYCGCLRCNRGGHTMEHCLWPMYPDGDVIME